MIAPRIPIWKKAPFLRLLIPLVIGIILQWQYQLTVKISWYVLTISIIFLLAFFLLRGFIKFKWITETNVFTRDNFNCILDENGLQVFGSDFNNLKPVKYLHELQNLYFDLKEKELEVHFAEVDQPQKKGSFRKEKSFALLSSNT